MGEAAADGAPVAHRAIGDCRRDLAQHLAAGEPAAGVLDAGMGDAGADAPGVTDILHLGERFQPRDVDQQRRAREPQIEHRSERLPAGQELGAASALESAANASAMSPGRT